MLPGMRSDTLECITNYKSIHTHAALGGSSIWERICRYKAPVVEPREAANFPAAIQVRRGWGLHSEGAGLGA